MLNKFNHILRKGRMLPLMEEFYTLQGEGAHTGQAAYFIRIGGCDVGCYWCDSKLSWNAKDFPPVPTDDIVERAAQHPAKAVVVTGGEPFLYPLEYLTKELHKRGIKTFVETSGAYILSGDWDWICLSPKRQSPPKAEALNKANELKVIIQDEGYFEWAEDNAKLVSPDCELYLQPEWSVSNKIMPMIVDYAMKYPKWKISLQSHKYMKIP
jgi:7-carboxy-7-deazaguanine synthase